MPIAGREVPLDESPKLSEEDRTLLVAILRRARTRGWQSGHRLGWVHQQRGVAVSFELGLLNLWWRGASGHWPIVPTVYPVGSLDEAVHVLIGLRLLPGNFCSHGRRALADVAAICDLAADEFPQHPEAAQQWRELARQARRVAGLLESL